MVKIVFKRKDWCPAAERRTDELEPQRPSTCPGTSVAHGQAGGAPDRTPL